MYKVLLGLHIFFVIVDGIDYAKKGRDLSLFWGLANAACATKLIIEMVS
jgi:hypothetical protein